MYQPQINHLVKDSPFNGHMYETYGIEEEYIRTMIDKMCVWGIDEMERNGKDVLIYVPLKEFDNGYIGFFVTEVPHNGKDIVVQTDVTPDNK